VRRDGVIERIGGVGKPGFAGDGGPAIRARISDGASIAALPSGGFLLAESLNHRIRRVSANGTITTVAGTGRSGFTGDGGPATQARLSGPSSVSALPDGAFLIADRGNYRVRHVGASGVISTVAGTGRPGFTGDGGPATAARLGEPSDVVAVPDGGFVIVDNDVVDGDARKSTLRKVSKDGTIETILSLREQRLMSIASSRDPTSTS
jgi:hypothetical protein